LSRFAQLLLKINLKISLKEKPARLRKIEQSSLYARPRGYYGGTLDKFFKFDLAPGSLRKVKD
jgi:hypothetical protein